MIIGAMEAPYERCKLPKLGLGGAPTEIEFCTFYPRNLTSSSNDLNDFPDYKLAKFRTACLDEEVQWLQLCQQSAEI